MSTESGTYTFEQKRSTDITIEGITEFSNQKWVMYSFSSYESKKFMIQLGASNYRVFHGEELLCDTLNLQKAVDTYNSITSKPIDVPKLDN